LTACSRGGEKKLRNIVRRKSVSLEKKVACRRRRGGVQNKGDIYASAERKDTLKKRNFTLKENVKRRGKRPSGFNAGKGMKRESSREKAALWGKGVNYFCPTPHEKVVQPGKWVKKTRHRLLYPSEGISYIGGKGDQSHRFDSDGESKGNKKGLLDAEPTLLGRGKKSTRGR